MSNINFLTKGLKTTNAAGQVVLGEGDTAGTTTDHSQVLSEAILKVQANALPGDASSPIDPTDES